ncbi:DUF2922 domain-containing protein [Thermohalobacter berrensis]|uniref:DUF2922 domain-containing protein n=1 Tax=Thermohalobacter berrensis TaxID=99594 RepID=A0A419T4C2_9FIRM|nr:DUF2922 domain-containing protein [Thermohalobacter berrensis]RKD32321.1 hypothetical protein BET03_03155 [Thermohalobacter berrensis]
MAERTLQLIFKNTSDRTSRLSIEDPRDNLTEAEINTVMNDIITRNIFSTSGGDLVRIAGARIITKDIQEFNL